MNKKLKYGGFSLLVTVLFLAGVVLLNILTGMLTDRFYLKADLTETGLYSLSDEAAEFLSGLSENIEITVLADESAWQNDRRKNVAEVLQNYITASNGHISVAYVNPDLNPQIKTEYPELSDLQADDIIIKSGRRAKSVSVYNMFVWEYDDSGNPYATGMSADQQLIGALLYVTNEQVARAVFLAGHDETPAAQFRAQLERLGYVCEDANIALEDIPGDATVVISAAPSIDFLPPEIEKLEAFISAGGNVMLFYDYQTLSLPLLDMYLEEWGVAFENKLIMDDQRYTYDSRYARPHVFARVLKSAPTLPTLELFENAEVYTSMYPARSIKSLWATGIKGSRTVYPLIESYDTSYAKIVGEGNQVSTFEREDGDESGPFMLGAVVQHSRNNANGQLEYSHMLIANACMIDDVMLTDSSYVNYFGNNAMMTVIAGDINPFGVSVNIPSKALAGGQMILSTNAQRGVLILLVIVLPLIILITGILVWRRRKHL